MENDTLKKVALSVGLSVVLTAVVSFAAAAYWFGRNAEATAAASRAAHVAELERRLVAAEQRLAVIDTTVEPISTAFQRMLVEQLTHYHTPVLDELLAKLGPPYTLTPDEEVKLTRLLDERTRDMGDRITASERDAAHMLPYVIERVKRENNMMAMESDLSPQLRVVYVPVTLESAEGE